ERAELEKGLGVIELFARTGLCPSKSEARRLITQGGAMINEKRIDDIDLLIDGSWLEDDTLMLKAGKKRYYRVMVK
ncbi:MAG TPA: S4 domain-containing protein, partial [Spirochaetia bacterium]|nr:S4 domain-containing protein [Spirochaetia bacterium]